MKKSAFLSTAAMVVLMLVLPLIGGAGPGLNMSVVADVGTTAPPLAAVPVPVKKGGVLLMTNRTPHVSFENNTDIVRWSMDLRYQSAALPTNAAFERQAGDSRESEDEGIPMACYPPEADFLVRSPLRPESVVKDAAEFHRLRREHSGPAVTRRW